MAGFMANKRREVTFLTFFLIWANIQGWKVPLLHVRICQWLDTCDARVRVLLIFRGAAKSTLYAIYKAFKFYKNPSNRSLIYAADDKLAGKLTRDTLNVLKRHPLCAGMLPSNPGALSFWINGSTDARNPSMEAVGVNSNATGSRADDADFDDIEVPKNIKTPEARLNLRLKTDDTVHILVPGWQKTFVGTPHTHDSIYMEQIEGGAEVLKIPLFEYSTRYTDTSSRTRYRFDFPIDDDGLYVIAGIYKFARIMVEGSDYKLRGNEVIFDNPPGVAIDICTGCAWPERFTREEIELKRKETRTLNAWDSQYQLEAKPVSEIRLDPARIIPYDMKPKLGLANRITTMYLATVRIVGAIAYWDCSLGKVKSDASAFTLMLTDERGNLYWQVAEGLTGDLADFDSKGQVSAGQCYRIRQLVIEYQIPCVVVETNGPGGFVPGILRRALAGTGCAVREEFSAENKQKRILDSFEPPLSSGFLWAHVDVLDGPVWDQMKDFNPDARNQEDDYIDSGAGAIKQTPVRIGKIVGNPTEVKGQDWRPSGGVYEVVPDYD
jgi:hypothetical protein